MNRGGLCGPCGGHARPLQVSYGPHPADCWVPIPRGAQLAPNPQMLQRRFVRFGVRVNGIPPKPLWGHVRSALPPWRCLQRDALYGPASCPTASPPAFPRGGKELPPKATTKKSTPKGYRKKPARCSPQRQHRPLHPRRVPSRGAAWAQLRAHLGMGGEKPRFNAPWFGWSSQLRPHGGAAGW